MYEQLKLHPSSCQYCKCVACTLKVPIGATRAMLGAVKSVVERCCKTLNRSQLSARAEVRVACIYGRTGVIHKLIGHQKQKSGILYLLILGA